MANVLKHPLFGPAFVIGVALSGFFDGILLHQVLQWHHLLSLVPGETIQRLTTQILADGLFHVLMYGIALAGGAWLWTRRHALAGDGASPQFWAGVIIGFGTWNIVDVTLFHWLLEIHHIRLDVAQPLVWDACWLLALGVGPVVVGALVGRKTSGGSSGAASAVVVILTVLVCGGWALRPPAGSDETLAVFAPDADPARVMQAVAAVDGQLVRVVGEGSIVVLRLTDKGQSWKLYRHGAWLVSATAPAGCLTWSTARSGSTAERA
ncbi:MAG TPA: DUF2243 domain-containing protein [Brevundimonas sp.]|jgi:uncharacterized membrane protein